MKAVTLAAPMVIVVTSLGVPSVSTTCLTRPELERDAAGQENRVEEIEFAGNLAHGSAGNSWLR